MNRTVFGAINEQINSEFNASYTYLAMAAFCERQKFLGAAKWLRFQSEEERLHGMKLFNFVLARDGNVELKTIEQPRSSFDSLAAVFEQAESVCRDDRAAMVSHRAGRRGEGRAGDRREAPPRQERPRRDPRHGSRARHTDRGDRALARVWQRA